MSQALGVAQAVAGGDLTTSIEVASQDEVGTLLRSLKTMNESLIQVVTRVREGSESVAAASAQIAQGNSDLSARTERQASALEETAASMEQLDSTVKQTPTTPVRPTSSLRMPVWWLPVGARWYRRWCRP